MNTLRVIYHGIHTNPPGDAFSTDYTSPTILRVTWPVIHSTSIVLISASEVRSDDVPRFIPLIERFIGDAPITVRNIAPQEGFVDFWIYAEWKDPLDVSVDIVVLDPPAVMVLVDADMQNQETFQVDASPQDAAESFVSTHLSKDQLKQYQALRVKDLGPRGHVSAVPRTKSSNRR
jgi:hypothetical protein